MYHLVEEGENVHEVRLSRSEAQKKDDCKCNHPKFVMLYFESLIQQVPCNRLH